MSTYFPCGSPYAFPHSAVQRKINFLKADVRSYQKYNVRVTNLGRKNRFPVILFGNQTHHIFKNCRRRTMNMRVPGTFLRMKKMRCKDRKFKSCHSDRRAPPNAQNVDRLEGCEVYFYRKANGFS
jgi:hypothetical protein